MIDGLRARSRSSRRCCRRGACSDRCSIAGQLLQPRQKSCGVGDDYVVDRPARPDRAMPHGAGLHARRRAPVDPVRAVRSDSAPIRNLLVDDKAGCRDCTWRHWCSGGCAVATFAATGRFDVRSPNCRIYKTIYPEAVRLEGLRLLAYARPTA